MRIIIFGIAVFFVGLFLHIALWRIRIPNRQTRALFSVFISTAAISFIFMETIWEFTALEYIQVALLVVSLTLTYIVTYPAIEVESPSILIVTSIAKGGEEGIEEAKLKGLINDDLLIKPRIADLVADKLIFLNTDKYKLTHRGYLVAAIFVFYRKLLNLGKGG